MDTEEIIYVRPYSLTELSHIYGVSNKVFKTWLAPWKNELGPKIGRYYQVAQVRTIFKRLSLPSMIVCREDFGTFNN